MATKTWIGNAGVAGDVNDASNWSPSGVPIAGDDLVFDGSANVDLTTNLGALKAIAMNNVIVTDKFTHKFGDASNFFEIQVGPGDVIHIDGKNMSSGGGIMVMASSLVIVESAPATNGAFSLAGVLDLSGGGIQSGNLTIQPDPNFPTNSVATSVSANSYIGPGASVDVIGTTLNDGLRIEGSMTSSSNVRNATITRTGSLTTTGTASLDVMDISGRVVHGGSGTVELIEGSAGSFDGDNGQAYTLTNATILSSNFRLKPGKRATITNPIAVTSAGATIEWPAGATISPQMPAA